MLPFANFFSRSLTGSFCTIVFFAIILSAWAVNNRGTTFCPLGGQIFVPQSRYGGQCRDKITKKEWNDTENMKKKSKYKLVRKVLIIAILQDCICSLYAFLFYLLFSHAEYLFPNAANRRYMNFSELNNVGMKFEPKNQGIQYVDIQHDTNSVTFL